ncbi:MAG: biosynthetic-type acetolactate synthase large subunit [Rikenellaceae bacterium]
MKNVRGTEALLLSLLEEGVDTIFGYPGGTIIPIYDELYNDNYKSKFNHILVRHEQGAVHAAEGYARATGKVGVCFATSGPGATNMVTGIADAMLDSTPLVCITAQVTLDKLGTDFFQEADMISITIPVTKWSYQITKSGEIASIIAKAFYIARAGRPGPVLISFTKNAQVEFADFAYSFHKPVELLERSKKNNVKDSLIDKVKEMINLSEKPLLIVGQGVILSGAEKEVVELAVRGNIPIASTLMGLSAVPSFHPLFAGNVGMHGNLAPNMMTQSSDLIIAVGMRFSDRVTGDVSKYAPNAKIIHIDIDKAELNKVVKADLPVLGDARVILEQLIGGVEYKDRTEWMNFAKEKWELENSSVINRLLEARDGPISMAQVVDEIAKAGEGEAVIVTDVGQNQMFSARYSKFKKTRSMITSGGLGTMGYGLPAAMGAKLGVPERQVVAILGDGGFQMSVQELGTIMQSQIGVKIVVLNNSFLGMVRQWQELFFDRRYSFTSMLNPDFLKIAEAYKIPAKRVVKHGELKEAIKEMYACDGPYFLEVISDSEENVFPMVPSGASLDDIIY